MSQSALDYVVAVSKDPDKADAHAADPDAAMDAHGLSDEDKEVLKSGDLEKIRQHLGDDSPPGCLIFP
jgi:hypothetical protein